MIDTEILQDYASEAKELLDEMDNSLIRLEQEDNKTELLNTIFRAVHCIKGSAEYIGLEKSSALTHGVENLLDKLREGHCQLNPRIMDFLFRSKDLILTLIDEVSREKEEKSPITDLMSELNDLITPRKITEPHIEPEPEPVHSVEGMYEESFDSIPEITTELADELLGESDQDELQSYTEDHFLEGFQQGLGKSVEPDVSTEHHEVSTYEPSESPQITVSTILLGSTGDLQSDVDNVTVPETKESTQIDPTGTGTPLFNFEDNVHQLLNLSLYFDDLQDGLRPAEVMDSILSTIDDLRLGLEYCPHPEPASILDDLRKALTGIDQTVQKLTEEDVLEFRNILQGLRTFYPQGVFPLPEPAASPTAETPTFTAAPTTELTSIMELPGVSATVINALRGAGLGNINSLLKTDISTLCKIEGITPGVAQNVLKAIGSPIAAHWAAPKKSSGKQSLLSDVDDELLHEFETIFGAGEAHQRAGAPWSGGRAADLLREVESVREETDREIIEIFLQYAWEIHDKVSPQMSRVLLNSAVQAEYESLADNIRAVKYSSSYMDYQSLAAFLDDWYEKTIWCSKNTGTLSPLDLKFMNNCFLRFEDFLKGLEIIINPTGANLQDIEVSTPEIFTAEQSATPTTAGDFSTNAPQTYVKDQMRPTSPIDKSAQDPKSAEVNTADARQFPTSEEPKSPVRESQPIRDSVESAIISTMRVDSSKVDSLLNQVGELVVNRSYVEQLSIELKSFQRYLTGVKHVTKKEAQTLKDLSLKVGEASISLGRVANDLQEGVMKLRMLPVGQLFNRIPRLIRDLSRRVGKNVALEVNGGETEVDKRVIEQIYNPLVHLVRNAVDHGIEDPETRRRLGKNEQGQISLSAYSQGNQVVIDIEDDGGGIDTDAISKRALETGIVESQELRALTVQDLYNMIFLPGFSTSKRVTTTSGRGVGMDVVKKDIEKINGHIEIDSEKNYGTKISIKIPLTLAIIQTLLIRSASHVFAIPLTSVREIIQVSSKDLMTIEGFEVLKFRDETVPVLRLREVFKLKNAVHRKPDRFLVLAVAGQKTVGFYVEELLGEQDVVIKPLAEHVCETRGLAGSTILGDGTIALVLDVLEVVEDVISRQKQLGHAANGYYQKNGTRRSEPVMEIS